MGTGTQHTSPLMKPGNTLPAAPFGPSPLRQSVLAFTIVLFAVTGYVFMAE